MPDRLKAEILEARALRETSRELRTETRAATARMREQIAEARREIRVAKDRLGADRKFEELLLGSE